MKAYGYVYMVRNKVNGKIYFGITENNFDTRYDGNIAKYTHNDHLKNSIKEYGIENFEINPQFDVAYNEDDLWDLEDLYICVYNTLDKRYGYNKRRSGSERKGHGKHSEESKNKMRESQKALYDNGYVNPMQDYEWSEEQLQQKSDSMKAYYQTEEGKQQLEHHSTSMKGKLAGEKNPMYGVHRYGEDSPHYGHKHTEETKQKLSEIRKEKGLSKGDKNPNAKAVICLETLDVFTTVKEAIKWCGSGAIGLQIKGERKSAGKHPITGQKLHWMYYDEYLKQKEVIH